MTRTVDQLFARYGEFHRHPANKLIHWVCVPLIVWSVLGLVWSLSPLAAYAAIAAALIFYGWLSLPLAVGMLAVLGLVFATSAGDPNQAYALTDEQFRDWGWRVPFLASALLIAVGMRFEPGVGGRLIEVYDEQVAAYQARPAAPGRAQVYVIGSGSVPPGRYRLRQGDPVRAGTRPDLLDVPFAHAAPELADAGPRRAYAGPVSHVWQDPGQTVAADGTVAGGGTTVMERSVPSIPALRLVTGSSVAETRMSGARAGRGPVELMLPDVPTVSREHARFTFADGRWWITNQGRNGLTLNGAQVTGKKPVSDGDTIRWGSNPDAPLSRVEIR